MALLSVTERGHTTLDAKNNLWRVLRHDREIATRPLHEIDRVELLGAVHLTARAIEALLKAEVDTVFLTRRGSYRGRLVGNESPYAERRQAQYRVLADPEQVVRAARVTVGTKLHNQYQVLRKLRVAPDWRAVPRARAALRVAKRRAEKADALEVLRGLEGHGAKLYFEALGEAIKNPLFAFKRRTRRPPRDPFNACLSFGYTLLLRRVETSLNRAGLDPALGALHDPGRGKPSLALDLMEGYRPLIVDRVVLRLINRRQLTPDDFVHPAVDTTRLSDAGVADDHGEAVYLGDVGRPVLIGEISKMWRTKAAASDGYERTLADHLQRDAYSWVRFVQGEQEAPSPLRLG